MRSWTPGSRKISPRTLAPQGSGRFRAVGRQVVASVTERVRWGDRLLAARTDIVLAGHDHNYQRYPRMNSNGSPSPRGIMSFVVGTGGALLVHITGNETPQGCGLAQSVRSRRHGVLKLRLGATSFRWAFVTPHGGVLDAGTRPTLR